MPLVLRTGNSECVLHGIDACEIEKHSALGPVEILIFGGGPIGLLFVAALANLGQNPMAVDVLIELG